MASKNHAAISRKGDGLLIRDMASKNGTHVNGQRIEDQLLKEGDTITIRDDRGYWNILEAFITERTAVRFSHGYCPECFEREAKDLNR